jgi:hypothetical protein
MLAGQATGRGPNEVYREKSFINGAAHRHLGGYRLIRPL